MISSRLALLFALVTAATMAAEPMPLFDGKTFTGWEGDTEKTWRIENGEFVAGSVDRKQPRNEFLSTKENYGNFELRYEAKLLGDPKSGFVNGGVQIRSERHPDGVEMIGYQADIGDPKYWGALYDESRRRKMLAEVEEALKPHTGWELGEVLNAPQEEQKKSAVRSTRGRMERGWSRVMRGGRDEDDRTWRTVPSGRFEHRSVA